MYIEFALPADSAGQAMRIILYELQKWNTKYQIPYTTKIQYNRLRVCFAQDEYYSFWAMTWIPRAVAEYGIVTDLNNRI